ncbi:MAG: hypothetical protein NVSMB52_16120 [Chloroflexota bacterium]
MHRDPPVGQAAVLPGPRAIRIANFAPVTRPMDPSAEESAVRKMTGAVAANVLQLLLTARIVGTAVMYARATLPACMGIAYVVA